MRIIVFILVHLLVGVRGFCDEPDIPAHSLIKETPQDGNNNRYDEGAYVDYRCEKDYTIQGNMRRTCQPNGTWTKIKFECTAKCDPPCENGGSCIRDGECRCNSHLITGDRCQTIDAYVEVPKNGNTSYEDYMIAHGQSYEIYCPEGLEFDFNDVVDITRMTITNDNGTLTPEVLGCIPAICNPPCENGGSCIRDGECRCNSHLITGDRCQTFICNDNCTINGGECTAPGICGKCPLSRSGEDCEIQGKQCNDIGEFHGGDYVYIGDRGNGTEAHYFCDDGYSQGGNHVEMSVCEVHNDVAMWNPAPPTCYADAFVEVPKNGNTTYGEYMIAHGQSYEIYCPEGLEFDFNDVVNITRMAIANDNGTLIPEVSGCIPARCNPSQLENTDILYLNGKPLVGLISNGYPFLYTCKPGYEFINEGYTKFIRGVCDFGKFQSAQECIPSCFIPDNKDFTYMKNNGNVVATMDQIRNGEVLYVKCSDIDESEFDDYNDYADQNNVSVTSTPKPQVLPKHNVTCERGILTEPDIQCSQDLCHELKNGKVTKISYDTYEVKCDIGYTINLRENWDHECSCGGGQLTCRGHIPLCSPDNCVIPEDYDSSKMIIFKDNFQISRDTKVIHGDKVIIDCTEKYGNVMEPDDIEYECRAGQWIPDGKQWLDDYNGTFPECKIIKKGCQVPDLSGKSQVNSKDGSEVSKEQYSYVRDGVLIILHCDNGDVMNSYSCIDGNWATNAHENLLQKLKGLDSINSKVSSSQLQGYIMALFENVVYETMEKFIAKVFQDRTLKCNTKERLD